MCIVQNVTILWHVFCFYIKSYLSEIIINLKKKKNEENFLKQILEEYITCSYRRVCCILKSALTPKHLGADGKHTWILSDKIYVATTVGDAGEQSLRNAYQVFKDEAQCLKADDTPTTVNMDGWVAGHAKRLEISVRLCRYHLLLFACFHQDTRQGQKEVQRHFH